MGTYCAVRIATSKEHETFLIKELGEPEEIDGGGESDLFFEGYWTEATWGAVDTIDHLKKMKAPFIYWCEAAGDWQESVEAFDGQEEAEVLLSNGEYVIRIHRAFFEDSMAETDVALTQDRYITGQYYLAQKDLDNFCKFIDLRRKLEKEWRITDAISNPS